MTDTKQKQPEAKRAKNHKERRVLSKKDLLATIGQHRREWVAHPNGGGVYVRELTAKQRDRYEMWVSDIKYDDQGGVSQRPILEQARAKLCCLTIVGEDNERYFADDELEQVDRLGASFVDDCFDVAREINGLRKKDIDELVGN